MPAQFYTDNVPKFFPLKGHTITWPRGTEQPWPGDAVPQMDQESDLQGHRAEAIIFGPNYFNRILAEMDQLLRTPTNGIFWVHGWYFDLYEYEISMRMWGRNDLPTAFQPAETTDHWALYRKGAGLKIGTARTPFVDRLIALKDAGVDVRIIGYVSPLLLKSKAMLKATGGWGKPITIGTATYDRPGNVHDRIYATFYNLLRLRADFGQNHAHRVIFNILNHPLGGAHSKMIIVGNDNYRRAFTGGIDLAADRNRMSNHDVSVCVEGKAATKAAQFFKDLWNEISAQQQRTVRFAATSLRTGAAEVVEADYYMHLNSPLTATIGEKAPLPGTTPTDQYVQMFRTLPRKNYRPTTPTLGGRVAGKIMGSRMGVSTSEGTAIVKALRDIPYFFTGPISFAMKGCFEFKTVAYKAVDAAEQYIMIMDQDVSNFELMTRINRRVRELRTQGQTLRVIVGTPYYTRKLPNASAVFLQACTMAKAHELFKRLSEAIPVREHGDHFLFVQLYTHAKILMVDDKWVSIGSANCMRRSFYTDIEMGFSILHETWVRDFRKALMASFMDASSTPMTNNPLQDFAAWFRYWQSDFPNVDFSGYIFDPNRVDILGTPDPTTIDNTFDSNIYNFEDPDSNSAL